MHVLRISSQAPVALHFLKKGVTVTLLKRREEGKRKEEKAFWGMMRNDEAVDGEM